MNPPIRKADASKPKLSDDMKLKEQNPIDESGAIIREFSLENLILKCDGCPRGKLTGDCKKRYGYAMETTDASKPKLTEFKR